MSEGSTFDDLYREINKTQDEISRLTAELAKARELLVRCIPHVQGNTGEWRCLVKNHHLTAEATLVAWEAIVEGDDLFNKLKEAAKGRKEGER